MATDTSQYVTDPKTGTTYTSAEVASHYGYNAPSTTPTTPTNQTTPVNTAQPNPATVNATPATNPATPPVTPAPLNPTTPIGNGTINPATGLLENPAQDAANAALKAAKASGPAPQTSTDGSKGVSNFLPPPPPDTTNVDTALANDPGYQQLLADRNAYNAEAGTSLLDTYKQLETDAGLPALNEKLLNLDTIINGTENDIRSEVQAANGFATNSQVLALSNARNKQNIQDYNKLLDTKKQAEDRINTMIGLSTQDKQLALTRLNDQMNFDQKMIDYRNQFIQNTNEAYKNMISNPNIGYQGLLSALGGDATAIAQVEKSLGLHPGGLQALADVEQQAKTVKDQASGITGEYQDALRLGLIPKNYTFNQFVNDRKATSTTNNTTLTYNQAQDQAIQQDISTTNYNLNLKKGKDGKVSPETWKKAYSDWLNEGHKGQDFIDNFSGYINRNDPGAAANYGVKL